MAGPSSSALEGKLLGGRYRLLESIGTGGMAAVWLGEDGRLGRPVAVKLLAESLAGDPAFSARFRREARVAASLAHPNLVGVYDFGPDAHPPYLVMEYVPGPNLAERLSGGEPVDPERLAEDLLAALDAIHRAGVVHRDVKPENVLVAPSGRAMLTDFGIARPEDATSITQTGQMPGTARYMAPELMRGEPASAASDLYSCGVVLGECIRGHDHRFALHEVIAGLAEPDPDQRTRSAADALEDLQGPRKPLATAPPVEGSPAPKPTDEPTVPAASARRGLRLGPPLAVLAVALVVVILITGSEDDPGEVSRSGDRERSADSNGSQPAAPPESAGPPEDAEASGADEEAPEAALPAPSQDPDPALGAALNDEGYSLIQAGRPDEAVEVLRRAVAAFGADTDDLTYAYALFNLGQALREAGRPEEAIPVLRRRLEIPNQTETVRAELEAAMAEAN
jgi:eukaryotic-like serine/threonine-protein kinase